MRCKPKLFIRRRRKPKLPTARPLNAVIIAIDAAKRSGASLWLAGKLSRYAELNARAPQERLALLRSGIELAAQHGLPCALVIEVPYGGHQSAALSLTASCALWGDSWLQLGQSQAHVLELTAGAWRPAVFGKGSAKLPRETVRKLESVVAGQIAAADLGTAEPIGADAAAAICIGFSCTRSGELHEALGCSLKH